MAAKNASSPTATTATAAQSEARGPVATSLDVDSGRSAGRLEVSTTTCYGPGVATTSSGPSTATDRSANARAYAIWTASSGVTSTSSTPPSGVSDVAPSRLGPDAAAARPAWMTWSAVATGSVCACTPGNVAR